MKTKEKYYLGALPSGKVKKDEHGDLFRVVEKYREGKDEPYELDCWQFEFGDELQWGNGSFIEFFRGQRFRFNSFGEESSFELVEIDEAEAHQIIQRVRVEKAKFVVKSDYRARTQRSQDKFNPDYLFRRRSEQRIGSDEPPSVSYESMAQGGRSWSEDRDVMRFFFGYEDGDLYWDSLTEDQVRLVILNWSGGGPGSPDPTRQPYTIKVE